MHYRTKTVTELTGISRNTLVTWERRYGVPEPKRLPNGYRFYSEADVQLLIRLRDALAGGLDISEAVEALRTGGQGERVEPKPSPSSAHTSAVASGYGTIAIEALDALLAFDRPRASRVLERALHASFLTLLHEIYFPMLRRVGDLCVTGEASIAQEHFCSAFVREQLVAILLRVSSAPPTGPCVVCVTFPGEQHELGLMGLAIHLALRSCRVTYLGPNLPAKELARFLQSSPQDVVCVSLIVEKNAREVLDYAKTIATAARSSRIIIGGAGLPDISAKATPRRVELLRDWRSLELR